MKNFDVLAFGEPLMEFAHLEREGERLYLPGFGGDVSNVAIAAARQGARGAIFTALGDDPFGQDFLRLWDAEGVDRSTVRVRERRAGESDVASLLVSAHPSSHHEIAQLRHEERLVRAALAHAHRLPADGAEGRRRVGSLERLLGTVRAHLGAPRGRTVGAPRLQS